MDSQLIVLFVLLLGRSPVHHHLQMLPHPLVLGLLASNAIALVTSTAAFMPNNRFIAECQITGSADIGTVVELVSQHGFDLWEEHLSSQTIQVHFLIRDLAQQSILEKSRLNCPHKRLHTLAELVSHYTEQGLYHSVASFDAYNSHQQIGQLLHDLANEFPNQVSLYPEPPKSAEGREIWVVRVSADQKSPSRPAIWVGAGIHAREWLAPAVALKSTQLLLQAFRDGSSPQVNRLLQNYSLVIAPCLNPDGYEWSRKDPLERFWRKNRTKNAGGSYGTDLNRNWPNRWGQVNSSPRPDREDYQGASAGSEPEIHGLIQFIGQRIGTSNLALAFDLHTYGQLVLRNYGWTSQPSPDEPKLRRLSEAMADAMNKAGRYQFQAIRSAGLYPTSGSSEDFFYEQLGVPGFILELPDKGGFGFTAPASIIPSVGAQFMAALLSLPEVLED